jgi:nucleoside 2-deoxyribosyltransferase
MEKSKRMVYISGALTDMSEGERQKRREFYEALGKICEEFGFIVYLPHVYGDPQLMPDLTPAEINRQDRLAVTLSRLVVAYVGVSSIGVGIEIELAYHSEKPVILLYEKEKLEKRLISRLVRGNPAVIRQIVFENYEDALSQFREFFARWVEVNVESSLPEILK